MQEKITHKSISSLFKGMCLASALLFCGNAFSQTGCPNETILYQENFGTGAALATHPDVTNLAFQQTGALDDGFYRLANNSQQRPEWHSIGDHTPTTENGRMLVINGIAETFYVHTITNGTAGFPAGSYQASLYALNTNTPGTCGPNALLPAITITLEYNTAATGNTGWVSLAPVTAAALPQTANPTWVFISGNFTIPTLAQRVRMSLSDGTTSGCGNDFSVDDIKFSACAVGGPLPVEFLGIDAQQKGAGVSVLWSTASEINNNYFDVEKSKDGIAFLVVNSVKSAGVSNSTKNYNVYDAQPFVGYNYYRIKQVDLDGRFKYSSVARVKVSIEKTGISILANPFANDIVVDFLSPAKQSVTVRLTDMTGKLISSEKWKLAAGSTRMTMSSVAGLQRGMYIFSVVDEANTVIFNNKLIKQ